MFNADSNLLWALPYYCLATGGAGQILKENVPKTIGLTIDVSFGYNNGHAVHCDNKRLQLLHNYSGIACAEVDHTLQQVPEFPSASYFEDALPDQIAQAITEGPQHDNP